MLYPSAMVKAVASLSLSNQSFTNWPLYPYHMEISRTRTARVPDPGPGSRFSRCGLGLGLRGPREASGGTGAGLGGRPSRSFLRCCPTSWSGSRRGAARARSEWVAAPPARGELWPPGLVTKPQTMNMVLPQLAQHHSVIHFDKTTQHNTAK